MSTKRAKVREMKRKERQRKVMLITGAIAVVVVIAAVFGLFALDTYNKSYIMTFEGEKISVTDFMFSSVIAESTDEATAKANSLDKLLELLVMGKAAADNGITSTEEEKTELLSYSSGLKSYYAQTYNLDLSFITDERMAELLESENMRPKLLEKMTEDFAIDEADYQLRLADFTENNKEEYYDIMCKYIINTDRTAIDEAKAELDGGAEFDDVASRYTENYNEETGVFRLGLSAMELPAQEAQRIIDMEVGGISDIIDVSETGSVGNAYIIIQIETYTIPDAAGIDTIFKEKYTAEKKEAIFADILQGWKDEANYTVNQRAYDAV